MAGVTVSSYDLRAALSLLSVYMGEKEPAGHFKDQETKLADGFYVVSISNLRRELEKQAPEDALPGR
jgi:hypothetical protein